MASLLAGSQDMLRALLKAVAMLLVVVPVLFLATCAYTSFSPHLRSDTLLRALMDAPRHAVHGWRSADTNLMPNILPAGQPLQTVMARLEAAGFKLSGDYSTGALPPIRNPDNPLSQETLDSMFVQSQSYFAPLGITHVFERGGRTMPACGETMIVELGFAAERLERATGYSRWTCL
jgi:hypothetical protein